MRMWRFSLVPAAAGVAVALMIAGCGTAGSGGSGSSAASRTPSATQSPPDAVTLAARVQAAVKDATSVRVTGTTTEGGKTTTVDMALTKSGEESGTVTIGGGATSVLTTGGKSYIKVTDAFLKEAKLPAGICSMMCGKWLLLPPAEASSLTGGADWSSLVGQIASEPPPQSTAGTSVTAGTLNGAPVWVIKESGSSIYVAAQGPAYVLRLVEAGQPGHIDFSGWNSVIIPPAPPASQVIDMNQLAGG